VSRANAERVLDHALNLAEDLWGERLIAAYTIGSLAHGGFSPLVSDLDFALILASPFDAQDAVKVNRIKEATRNTGMPLADRLSLFWASSEGRGGRLPPVDRLDLSEYGVLSFGSDVRGDLPRPTQAELVVASARFARTRLGDARGEDFLRDPSNLAAAGQRELTKFVLFPVRLVYTARTGRVGRNEAAVAYFQEIAPPGPRELARRALQWRDQVQVWTGAEVAAALEHLQALYEFFIDDYAVQLERHGQTDLSLEYRTWYEHIHHGCGP
jgi:hypothetical protein